MLIPSAIPPLAAHATVIAITEISHAEARHIPWLNMHGDQVVHNGPTVVDAVPHHVL